MNDTTDSTVTPQRLAILWQDIIIAGCRTLLDMADDDTLDGPPGGPRLPIAIFEALHEIPDFGPEIALTALGALGAWLTDREAVAVLTAWQERAQTRLLIDDHRRTCPACGLVRPDWTVIKTARAQETRS
ncbi:hypothetical protein C4901_11510 [Acidiferrobacter sp. SPIII_3]|uniref:hypothetical protein n=1 Tax=Acidiferrobacter sp. SPIII_3 TaxID=1281578 RepID=UPI000D73C1A5|nr:hypothetical protein [Acidiferrobacter sp. SPIII_3]AWP23875.1 hypothetical protein C4901_11510 [Acidiferrobacter sp. SPIII_3]